MDNMKAPFELIAHRSEYYKFLIESMLRAIGVDIDTAKLEFVTGSSYQWDKDYTIDSRRLEAMTKLSTARKAGAQVIKQSDDPFLGGLIYPIMQALDEQYLDVDAQLGGIDQRKIFTFALENLPKLGYKKRAHLMNAMVPGLGEAQKMSSSEPSSKIGLLDTPEEVSKKLKKVMCVPEKVEGNGVIAFIEHIIFRVSVVKTGTPSFAVGQRDGEPLVYEDILKVKQDYEQDILTPQMIKAALVDALNKLLEPIRGDFHASAEWQRAAALGYAAEEAAKPPGLRNGKKKAKRVPTTTITPCDNDSRLEGA
jgi:tyrosyl-tRNA synthetase